MSSEQKEPMLQSYDIHSELIELYTKKSVRAVLDHIYHIARGGTGLISYSERNDAIKEYIAKVVTKVRESRVSEEIVYHYEDKK